MPDLEYLIQILKFCEKELTKVVPGVWWVQSFGKYRLLCIELLWSWQGRHEVNKSVEVWLYHIASSHYTCRLIGLVIHISILSPLCNNRVCNINIARLSHVNNITNPVYHRISTHVYMSDGLNNQQLSLDVS